MVARTWIGLGGPSVNRTRPVADKAVTIIPLCFFDLRSTIVDDSTDLLSTMNALPADLLSTITNPFDLRSTVVDDSRDLESTIDDSPTDLDGELC